MRSRMARVPEPERGLTLVEVLAALTIFTLVTVGIFPLLASSIRGATLSRSTTIGKNVAVRAMERIRGLPFSRSVATTSTARKVDVLDLFFPCAPASNAVNPACALTAQPTGATNTGTQYVYTGTVADPLRPTTPLPTGTFMTTCTTITIPSNAACPRSLPAGYAIRFDAQFVKGSNTNPETYSALTATTSPALSTTYNWSTVATEGAPSQIVKIRVNVYWTVGDETEMYELESLVAERKLAVEKIQGTAKVDYAVRVLASYNSGGPALSDMSALGAQSASGITSRLTAVAEEIATGGQALLTRQATATTESVPLASPPPVGASGTYAAPPDQTSLPDPSATAPAQIVNHPEMCQNPALTIASGCQLKSVGFLAPTHIKAASVAVASDLPTATGSALFSPLSTSTFDMYIDAQRNVDTATKNPLQLEPNTVHDSNGLIDHPVLSIRPNSSVANNTNCLPTAATISCRSMYATTTATTRALSPATSRGVETTATTGFAEMRLFPATFIPGAQGASKAAFEISNFTARVNCKATGSTTGANAASATPSWSAQLRYWRESTGVGQNDGVTSGGYSSPITITSVNVTDQITSLKSSNPLIYEQPGIPFLLQSGDLYMFPKQNLLQGGQYPSLFTDIQGSPGSFSVTDSGTVTSASIGGALTLLTSAIDPDVPQSAMSIVLGSLSCSAADRRT